MIGGEPLEVLSKDSLKKSISNLGQVSTHTCFLVSLIRKSITNFQGIILNHSLQKKFFCILGRQNGEHKRNMTISASKIKFYLFYNIV